MDLLLQIQKKLKKLTIGEIVVIFIASIFLYWSIYLSLLILSFSYLIYRLISKHTQRNRPLKDPECKLKLTPAEGIYSQREQKDGKKSIQIVIRINFHNISNERIKIIEYNLINLRPKIKIDIFHKNFFLKDPKSGFSYDVKTNNLSIPPNFSGNGLIHIHAYIDKINKNPSDLKVKIKIIDDNNFEQILTVLCKPH